MLSKIGKGLIGMVLVSLALLAVPTASEARPYFVPGYYGYYYRAPYGAYYYNSPYVTAYPPSYYYGPNYYYYSPWGGYYYYGW